MPLSICSNNTMIMISFAQMRETDECGSVGNDEKFFGSGADP